MQSMKTPGGDNQQMRLHAKLQSLDARTPSKRAAPAWRCSLIALLGCAGLEASLGACSDATAPREPQPLSAQAPDAPSAASARQPALAIAPAASSPAFEAPWLANVASSARHPSAPSLPCPPSVPEALNPPADATLELAWPASGVQIYACARAKPSDTPGWALEAPHALLTSGKTVAAIHFAGPIWQGLDGSQVKGARLAAADAPESTAVPWLSMSATPIGEGTFAHTTFIQRLATSGGKAPLTGCDAAHLGAKALVPYQASYFFYRRASGGEAVHQCRSGAAKPGKSVKP